MNQEIVFKAGLYGICCYNMLRILVTEILRSNIYVLKLPPNQGEEEIQKRQLYRVEFLQVSRDKNSKSYMGLTYLDQPSNLT